MGERIYLIDDFYFNKVQVEFKDFYKKLTYPIQLSDCKMCPRATERNMLVLPQGNPNMYPVWIGRDPGKLEEIHGVPFYRDTFHGKIYDKYLAVMGWSRAQVYTTNGLFCRGNNSRPPAIKETILCAFWKSIEIDWHNRVVFPMGQDTTALVLGRNFNFHFCLDKLFFNPKYNSLIVPVHHPGYLMRKDQVLVTRQLLYLKARKPVVDEFIRKFHA